MGGNHARTAAPQTRRMRRWALALILPIAALTLVATALLWPTEGVDSSDGLAAAQRDARVTAIDAQPCEASLPDDVNGCGTAGILLEDSDTDVEVALPNGAGAPRIAVGDDVVVTEAEGPDGPTYTIVDHQRGTGMWVLVGVFALALVAFGRLRGLAALLGLAVTFGVLLLFVVPAVLAGSSPVLVAIVGAALIVLTVLYLTHGLTLVTTVAVVGTLASLALTGVLAVVATAGLNLTGVTDDLSGSVFTTYGVDMAGLLVAAIIIGSVGVLDDVTVTQSATVAELAAADPTSGVRGLYAAASRVGRAHIASVVNTIVLAYAGSTLPLLLLIVADNSSFTGVVTTQLVAQEIARSAVATLGLVAAVPITTLLASVVIRRAQPAVAPPPAHLTGT
ncbi:YibE/F family protein [uncultured Nocardioides sp.]|uniref:YibE/F family protein n=1 Tax=uncultured Nocardioides sp. TaxID=198441 RepID=UPI0026097B77|nr:YibE/F family protein [uncultured Nocardioides sp.]